jgi:hypothetical protein
MHRPQKFSLDDLKLVVEPEVRQFCGPLYFARSLESASGVINNGSFGLIDTGRKKMLVTCHHVWNDFQKAQQQNPELKMLVCLDSGPFVVLDAEKPLGEDKKLDIATFDMEPLLGACGGRKYYPLNQKPPRKVERGAVLFVVGFPAHFRTVKDIHLSYGRQAIAMVVADCNHDGSKFISNITSLNLTSDQLAGISGSPCFLGRENFPIQLVGFVTEAAMNILHFTHARCLSPDGTIKTPTELPASTK